MMEGEISLNLQDVMAIVSLLVGAVALVVSVFAIVDSRAANKDARAHLAATEKALVDQTERVRDLLASVDKKAAVIDNTVRAAQERLLDMTIRIVDAVVIRRTDASRQEELTRELIQLTESKKDPASPVEDGSTATDSKSGRKSLSE